MSLVNLLLRFILVCGLGCSSTSNIGFDLTQQCLNVFDLIDLSLVRVWTDHGLDRRGDFFGKGSLRVFNDQFFEFFLGDYLRTVQFSVDGAFFVETIFCNVLNYDLKLI